MACFLVDQKCETLKIWQETWEKDNKGRRLFKIKPTVTLSSWFKKINIPRKAITYINFKNEDWTLITEFTPALNWSGGVHIV